MVELFEKIEFLEKALGSQVKLSKSLRVTPRAIRYWKTRNRISDINLRKVNSRFYYYSKKLKRAKGFMYYSYLFSLRYDQKGKKGRHPIHLEVRVDSPKEMSEYDLRVFVEGRLIEQNKSELIVPFNLTKLVGMERRFSMSRVTLRMDIVALDRRV